MRLADLIYARISTRKSTKNTSAGRLCMAAAMLLAFALALVSGAQAQGNFVYVNNQTASNAVNAYSVSSTGALTAVPGSPYSTGGVGANVSCYGLNRIVASGAANLLFVANTGNQTISVFRINPATGTLALAAGSPFPSGLTLDSCQGISLAATPDGQFLMASSNGKINTFSVAPTGALTLLGTTPNCCTPMAGMVISANGNFLAVSNENSVSVYTIASGVLTPVLGSPFPKTGTGLISGLDFNCAGDRLYGGEATGSPTITDAWTVDGSGALTPVPGSPFHTAGNDSNDVHLSPDNTLLFESNQFSNSVNSFNLNSDGSLSNVGKFGSSTAVHVPAGMATDAGGRFLYIADDNFGVAVFRINAGGLLTPLSDVAISRPGEIQDLAAFPPRSCASADLAITKTTGPSVVAGSPIVYTIAITNNGPAAASAVVSDTFPAGTTPGGNLKIVAATGAQRLGGIVTIHTTAPHQIFVGEKVAIAGVGDASFNGSFVVASVPDTFSFTYSQTGPDATSGSGTATTANCQIPTGGTGVCGGTPTPVRTIPIVATTGASRVGGVVTITTTAPHVLLAGQTVTISGVSNTSFNGTFVIATVPTPTTFTYSQAAADATSGGGNAITGQTQIVTFSSLASGETQTALLTTTTAATAANGTVISNTAIIGNKSVVDPAPGNNVATAAVTVGTPSTTKITVPDGTGPYGGFATLTAILTNSVTNAPIAGETLTFQLNGNQASAVTDATGTATVTTLPIGTISVGTHTSAFTVSFGGDASFQASSAVGTLVVTKARLTVTADNQSRLYGDPNPPLTYTFSGFVNGDTAAVVSGTANCTTAATPASPVGTYPITCTIGTLSATNYDFVFVDGTLTVNPAPLTVTVNNATRAYGDPNPVFTGTIVGIKNGDNITATYSTTATITSPVGTYPITATLVDPGNVLGNYAVTINAGTLTITPAALVVTANNAARLYGDPNPVFTGTIAGIKNGDNITAIYTTTATPASPIGTYPIIPTLTDNGTGALANYIVTANNGSLTVSPTPLTVTAANATRPYGAPNPVFTGTIVGIKNNDNITATYSTTATVTSPAGTYPIIPAVSDNGTGVLSNYIVTVNNGTLTVTQAVLTVTAANATMVYGDPLPLLTGTITGIVNGDNITATYSTVATSASPVGTYAIVPTVSDNGTGALANYIVVINNGILTITPAPLTVTAANATRLYGDPNPAFTGTIVGIKNGDAITATFATAADPTSPVGAYPIVPTLIDPTLKLGNYTVTSINGTLTITPAPLAVTANNASRLFSTPNPPLSGIITGIKNGDAITATYSTTAIVTSLVGTYPITPTLVDPTLKLGNYTVTSNNGTLTVNSAPTGNFVFVNNQAASGNSISGYSVAADGTLTALAGSPVLTGGLGGTVACSSVDRIALSAGNNLLFVSNSGDLSISAFQINPASGALTAVAGSPFASGLSLDACGGISLAATPDGGFLMASSNGQIRTFSIGATGALSPVATAANPVLPNASMKISANGQYLAVSNGTSVSVYTINGDGSLTAVAGSPFAETGTATLAGLDFSSTSGLLYGAESSATSGIADAWTVASGGALSAVLGSPFSFTGVNSNAVLLSPDNSLLFASNQGGNSVSSFSVSAGGGLTSIGSFGSAASLHAPVGMSTDRSGSLLYVADDTFGVAVFRIGGAGSLSQLGDTAIAGAGQIQSLVAYPPRMTSTADISIAAAAGSANVVAGQNVTYTLTVTNNGPDPASVTVTDSLPAGFTVVSCAATGNGACAGTSGIANFYLLQSGETQTVTLVASTSLSIPDGTVTTNTASISNNSAVDPNAANNSASVNVTVAQPVTTTLTVAAASGAYGGSTTLSATLKDAATNPIAGKSISFSLNGTAVGSAVTDATGLASIPASLVGINAGTYTGGVTASFAGDPNTKASSGSADLVVNPALLTVTATGATRVYGDPNPVFAFTITGFVNGETSSVLTGSPICTTTATQTSVVGAYPITCTQGTLSAANYTFTFVSGTLTVTSAPLTVTAANATRVYGDPNPAFTGAITGIKNGDNISAIYATTATATSPVGTYAITAGLVDPTSKLSNYTVTVNNGVLTVSPAPLTVTAANATMVFGGPVPALTGTITGIRNGDNITATYSTTATSASPVGTYPIVPAVSDNATGALSNYAVTINNGTLTITQSVLTVTAANASMVYGDPLPLLTGTITGILNGDNITATYTTVATSASPVGTYAIVPVLSDNGTGALANYTVVINNGVLTINPAPLSVTAANTSMVYGDPVPALTGVIVGIKNGDNITATFSTTATSTSLVGTYPIVPTLIDPTLKLGNYTVTSINGTLTITAAPLTVTADNASRLFGAPNPPLTGTIAGIKNGDNITATYSTTATAASLVGTYPITPALVDPTLKLSNYAVTSNNGTLTVNAAPTGNFVFVNNQAATGNSISGYSVAADGTLTALAGSPVATGGLGATIACSSVDRMALSAGNNLLFVSNSGDLSISAFQINPASGALTAVAGSPFASGLTLDACGGISLAASPDGRFLMASSNGQIKTFSIGATGALSPAFTAANPVVPNASMKISANGQYLAVSDGASVAVFTINADGSLAAVAGSPFAKAGTGTLAGLDFSSTSGLLFGAEASATSGIADAWTVAAGGVLSPVAGSPFSFTGVNSNALLLSPDNSLLFASNQGGNSVSSFSVSASGSLTSIGSFGSAASLHAPVGMATDRSGSLLYVADDTFGVAVFRVSAASLSQLSDTAIAGAGQVQNLVAYPARMASTADVGIAAAAGSPSVVAGQNVTYTLTVTNNGPDPASVTVTDTLPSGFSLVSCSATGNGACIANSVAANFYLLQSGETQTVTLVATASLSIPDGTVTTDTASITNNSAVDPNAANNSASATVTVAQPTTTTLTVAPASATFGASTTTLSATLKDSLGNPVAGKSVSFTFNAASAGSAITDATGTASVPGSLAGINAGTYAGAVSASFAGDANTQPASGSANFVLNPAVLTVTAGAASRVYGDPNPAFTFTFSGFVNGDTAAVLTGSPSCTTVADPTSAVGTFPITCSAGTLAATNYTFAFVSGTLTITPAPLTVSAADASRVYGDPNPAFTGTITGIKNGDNITATYSTTATAASVVGTYPITPALVDPTGKLGNYTVTSTNGTLTVTPAPLTVAAAGTSRAYGDPNPVLTGTITGIKNADNITATYSTVATQASAIGPYAIVPALVDPTGKLSNYTVTSNNGTLTVTAAPLTVTAANASRFYGDANPVFTGTIAGIKNGDNITATYASAATVTSAPGAYAIVPTVSDNATGALANYAVTVNNGVLTVNAAPLTVVADNATRAYGAANPVFTGTITGLKNGDAITATYTSATDATSNAGTYPIVPVLSDPTNKLSNYSVTLTNGTLTITPVPLTITAANASRVYGDPNPAFTGTITGLLNGDNITATYSSADPTAAVGTYPIVPAAVDPTGKLGNYTVTLNNGILTVTPAPLSVTAANASRQYGDPNVLTGTITGIKNGDNITATYSTTATATSPVGTYPITPALVDPTGKLGNYTVTSTNGTLTVTPALLTVTAANASMVYGDLVPALTGTITGIRNGDTITATYASATDPTTTVGNYPIVPTLSDGGTGALSNYAVTSTNGTLTITQAPLTIQANDATRVVGAPDPVFTGTITGIKNADNITATYSTTATAASPAGTYPIIPAPVDPNGLLVNYSLTLINGTLTVTP